MYYKVPHRGSFVSQSTVRLWKIKPRIVNSGAIIPGRERVVLRDTTRPTVIAGAFVSSGTEEMHNG